MFLQRGSRQLLRQLPKGVIAIPTTPTVTATVSARSRQQPTQQRQQQRHCRTARGFHSTRRLLDVKPVLLADIGEGIVECEIIQWFVEPGARVEEFSPLCEVQSDKASVEITSRFSGVVKKLYYDAGEMAKVGKPFVDIDITGDLEAEPEKVLAGDMAPAKPVEEKTTQKAVETAPDMIGTPASVGGAERKRGKCAALATPAVRHLSKELKVDINEIDGTGRDGRVLKEDIYKFVQGKQSGSGVAPTIPAAPAAPAPQAASKVPPTPAPLPSQPGTPQTEEVMQLSHTQQMMFKTMTRSLTIPHFLYADEIDFTSLVELRTRLNRVLAAGGTGGPGTAEISKLSYLPFIIKAVSLALYQYPILNARVDIPSDGGKPSLAMRKQHNIGVAMDTPSGLLVPVVKNVNERNVLSIAAELVRLQSLATAGKLSPADMSGGTMTVSNIGSIGGTYLSPVVVEREVAILGVGRMRTVPAFDENDKVVKKHVCNFSWCADHRVVDGATLARAANMVRQVVEEPDVMVMHLR
ncbi:hypothetical protein MCOR27_009893 [Pyricularia oryzae]|uniref:Dihydrolipoamide acetyltransferase component of pyruvate dehydrogenase complex n=1 Tax=Pyricularia grisea TaxID=148305 RepID=A0ABQ8N7E6_PYRGI|nr:hypothetical protein MCOR01_011145 [Pyricularia oryzae]KAI6292508.1 hypothetical protein MCOR33_009812 [Pyricularia grisea]KAI6252191.1 hypothetical protein MCOR19_011197 [Pyricularia oryzae]KAI6269087.1 hypothetical protein MCOR27_009893 [Pyricularia oryzae]KAI6278108.1 hypothetical protein MCOR26_004824 [Pyricularia oryzae]